MMTHFYLGLNAVRASHKPFGHLKGGILLFCVSLVVLRIAYVVLTDTHTHTHTHTNIHIHIHIHTRIFNNSSYSGIMHDVVLYSVHRELTIAWAYYFRYSAVFVIFEQSMQTLMPPIHVPKIFKIIFASTVTTFINIDFDEGFTASIFVIKFLKEVTSTY